MKKVMSILFLIVTLFSFIVPSVSMNTVYADSEHKAVFLFTTLQNEKEVVVKVKLQQNDGVVALNMELSYDIEAMVLTNVVKGSNFSSLIYTQADGPDGFGVTPFIFNWMNMSKVNDNSTGTFITMTFRILDNAPNGTYNIGFKNIQAHYCEQGNPNQLPVTTIVDTVKVTINNGVIETKTANKENEAEELQNSNVGLIVGLSFGGAVVVGGIAVFVIRKQKQKKGWQKLNG